jgi:polyphosphate kinase 2 (PPK2 family)
VSEGVLKVTSTGPAPWHIVDATDAEYRHLKVLQTLNERIEAHLQDAGAVAAPRAVVTPLHPDEKGILSTLDHSLAVPQEEYKQRLKELQAEIFRRARRANRRGRSTVVVFEGMDAAGKGGAIRRLTAAMDVRNYLVVPVAAPTDEERAHPYMWRFWRQLPRQGRVTIFDRSWYGRVLVEPIEGFCSRPEWERAYKEINDFEAYLDRHGTRVIKFWLSLSKEEQLKRFEEREKVGHKRFKITPDDWRNREKWELYEAMVHRMVERTSTGRVPWHLIPANDKLRARLEVMETLCQRLE